jgi:hypothetical protein
VGEELSFMGCDAGLNGIYVHTSISGKRAASLPSVEVIFQQYKLTDILNSLTFMPARFVSFYLGYLNSKIWFKA